MMTATLTSLNRFAPPLRLTRPLGIVAAAGGAVTLAGLFIEPSRAWPNLLLASYYALGLALGGVLFIALQYVSNAGWSVALRRVPEAMASGVPVFGALLLVTFLGIPSLYEWSHAETVAADPLLQAKAGWLSVPFFVARAVLIVALWTFLARRLVRLSRTQDTNGTVEDQRTQRKYAAAFLVVFGITITLASFDWIMSLEPHWYSTIFGVYHFSGLFESSLAAIAVMVILLRRYGPLRHVVTSEHLHNLGKLIFAFSTFWMYIGFSQYLLIWYANIPEETVYFLRREQGSWNVVLVVNVLFNWVVPFLVLLPRWTKMNESILLRVSVIVLIGRWVDLFWMIMPPFAEGNAHVGLWEIAPVAAMLALFALLTGRALSKWNIVPVNDPLLVESLHPHG